MEPGFTLFAAHYALANRRFIESETSAGRLLRAASVAARTTCCD